MNGYLLLILLLSMSAYGLVLFSPGEITVSYGAVILLNAIALLFCHFSAIKATVQGSRKIGLDVFFLLGFSSVHFSILFFFLTEQLAPIDVNWRYGSDTDYLASSAGALLGIGGFSVGYLSPKLRTIFGFGTWSKLVFHLDGLGIREAGYCSLIGTIFLFVFYFRYGSSYFSGSYSGLGDIDEVSLVSLTLSQVGLCCGAALLVVSSNRESRLSKFMVGLILIPYCLLLLLLTIHGDRGGVIMISGPLVGIVLQFSSSRWSGLTLIIGFAISVIVLAGIREARHGDERSIESVANAILSSFGSEAIESTFENVGYSGLLPSTAVNHTASAGFYDGRIALQSLAATIPYGRRLALQLGFPLFEGNSSGILSNIVLGETRGSGVGTTSVCDFYLDFGWIGVFFGHMIIGIFAATIDFTQIDRGNHSALSAIKLVVIGVFAIMSRYSATTYLIRFVLYPALLMYFVSLVSAKRR